MTSGCYVCGRYFMWFCIKIMIVILLLFIIISLLFVVVWTYFKILSGVCKYSGHLVGKVVIVTGANSGIGYETAKDLAQRGARVILACRNLERGASARDNIIASSGNNNVHLLHLDLESLSSVRLFADRIYQSELRLDILINNAGQYYTENKRTQDGLLLGMQVNYFAPFLLTSLLLPLLKVSTPSRIINVSSMLHAQGVIDFENINMEQESNRTFSSHKVYRTAKLCLLLMTIELGRRCKLPGVTANSLHPGMVYTEMVQDLDNCFFKVVLRVLKPFFKSPREGAQTTIHLAVSPDVQNENGCYFKDCHKARINLNDRVLESAQKLWDVSEQCVKLK